MAVRGSQEKFALEFLSVIIKSWGRGGGERIVRHFYYKTMQELCKFEALYRPEIECKCHKDSPLKEQFFENTCFIRNICKYRFKKKLVLKFPKFLIWKM